MAGAPLASWGWVLASALVSERLDMCHWNGSCGGIWELYIHFSGLYLEVKQTKVILCSLCGVIVSLSFLGLVFYLANAVSPAAFAAASLSINDSFTDSDCQVHSKIHLE